MHALKSARDVSALKAVSQNLMHENLTITDGVYGILSDADMKKQIVNLGKKVGLQQNEDLKVLLSKLDSFLSRLDENNNMPVGARKS